MRLLTLNLHCRQEREWQENLEILADFIIEHQVDVVALQECAQPLDSRELSTSNDVTLIQSSLKKRGLSFDVKWALNHIGFDSFYEGLGVLSRFPILNSEELLISETSEITHWQTRKAQILSLDVLGRELKVCNLHLGLEGVGLTELSRLTEFVNVKDFIVVGDFNIPDSTPAYSEMTATLSLPDVYLELVGSSDPTFFSGADGWKGVEGQRIDYVFGHGAIGISRVFIGTDTPRISDHVGLLVDFTL